MIDNAITFLSDQRLSLGPWQAFERGIARFLQHVGFKDVRIVNGPGDKGADVVGYFKNELWVVQAKYTTYKTMGKFAIKEALNALQEYDADVCVTATNKFFSKDAKDFNLSKRAQGFKSLLWDRNNLINYSNELPFESKNRRTCRPYQLEALNRLSEAVEKDERKGLITLATGLGKTMVASSFISDFFEINPKANVLVLAHRQDLVHQLDQACWSQLNSQVSSHVWTGGEIPSFFEGIVFATWQSVLIAMDNGFINPEHYSLIIVDECHHAPSQGFTRLLNELEPSFLLGVTATPWRTDNISLKPLFGEPLFSMSVVEGMQKGYLSKVDYKMLTDGIDWDKLSELSRMGHTVKNLNANLYVPERDRGMVEEISETIKSTNDPRVLVFCRTIAHAERLLGFFKMYGINSSVLHSKLSKTERFKELSRFRIGRITVLISIDVLNEGIDVPEVNIVCFARVTHSRRIFLQQLGRGLRLSENKKEVKVLDFVADIRRIAEGIEINKEAIKYKEREIVNYPDGEIVKFTSDPSNFFDQYLKDMSNISDLDESSRLEFPS